MNAVDRIVDPDVRIIAGIASMLEPAYVKDGESDPWRDSPFKWIQTRPSRQKGAIGEALVAGWAAARGLDVARSPTSDADRIIHGHRIEIKYSNLWTDTCVYKFQQMRDQQYDFCLCFGLSPFDAHAWFIPKAEIMGPLRDGLAHQHGGQAGSDTRWLSFEAACPPDWLRSFGGRFSDVHNLLIHAGRGSYRGR